MRKKVCGTMSTLGRLVRKAGPILVALSLVTGAQAMQGDSCSNPWPITTTPFNEDRSTGGYTADYNLDTACTGHTTLGRDFVYAFTPPDSGCWHLSVAVPFGMWNLSLYILDYCDTIPAYPAYCYAGSDVYGIGGGEALNVELAEGVTYYIVVDGTEANDSGSYNFGISECVTSVMEDGSPGGLGPASLTVSPTITKDHADIRFELARETYVELNVYSQTGALVKTLVQGHALGAQNSVWDTRDNHGTLVPQGTYFVALRTGQEVTLKKLSVLR